MWRGEHGATVPVMGCKHWAQGARQKQKQNKKQSNKQKKREKIIKNKVTKEMYANIVINKNNMNTKTLTFLYKEVQRYILID